jgi:outer membrane PBP1 activator LpoA protein
MSQTSLHPASGKPVLRSQKRIVLLPLLAALLAAGCSTMQVTPSGAPHATAMSPTFTSAAELARMDATLSGQAKVDNAQRIERLLAALDDATLARETAALPAGEPLYNFAGRALLNRGLPLPRPFDRGGNWHFDAGNRPPADSDGYRPPQKLAVLLPLTGSLATAAAPVRDGLLTGYYSEHRRRPEIVFYDTAGTSGGAIAAYGNAIAAAEYLLARNARRILVLSDDDDSMRRAVNAFREQLLSRGGGVTDTLTVADKPGDMAAALQAAARKEGGVDAVFLALKASQARALAPQLALAGLGGKPRVATSQLAAGVDGSAEGRALDGIAFPSEAWGVRGVSGLPPMASVGKTMATARGPAAKLFAFGYDAWLLTAYLERLTTRADGNVQGATGTLRIDGFGNVVRTPSWSTFSDGNAVPLGH